ncbi:hypothetical protein ILUMI_02393, partial [Ignelater luminosus]
MSDTESSNSISPSGSLDSLTDILNNLNSDDEELEHDVNVREKSNDVDDKSQQTPPYHETTDCQGENNQIKSKNDENVVQATVNNNIENIDISDAQHAKLSKNHSVEYSEDGVIQQFLNHCNDD